MLKTRVVEFNCDLCGGNITEAKGGVCLRHNDTGYRKITNDLEANLDGPHLCSVCVGKIANFYVRSI